MKEGNRPLSQSFFLWLFGYQISQTTIIITATKSLIILASSGKIGLFEALKKKVEKSHIFNSLTLITKNKDNEREGYDKVIETISKNNITRIGYLKEERNIGDGEYLQGWYNILEKGNYQLSEFDQALALLFAIKSIEEGENIRKSSRAVSSLLSGQLKARIESIIDDGSSVNHHILAKETEDAIEKASSIEGFPEDIEPDNLELSFPPLIQSGGIYNIAQGVPCDENNLNFDTIIVLLGVQYKNYNSVIGRTYMVDPSADEEKNYKVLQQLRFIALKSMKPEATCGFVYDSVKKYLEENNPELLEYLPDVIGYGIGLQPQEDEILSFKSGNQAIIKAGMTFVLQLSLLNIKETDPKYTNIRQRKTYSLLLADTCLTDQKALKILTKGEYKDVAYTLSEESDEEDSTEGIDSSNIIERRTRNSVLMNIGDEKRRQKLEEIISKKKDDYIEKDSFGTSDDNKSLFALDHQFAQGKIVSYASTDKVPKSILKKNRIAVDPERATILLPINGVHIPFHIASIKSISASDELNHVYLRINFNTQGINFGKKYEPAVKYPEAAFIKEISYRSKDGRNINHIVSVIKEVRKRMKQIEKEKQQRSTLVQQDKLKIIKGAYIPRIRDIYIRPNINGKKTSGILEAHVNGLRFTSEKGAKVYINYSNVKHAFYQKAEHDTIVLIHFHLFDGIMIGKQQQKDIQFFTEVMEEFDHLSGRGQRHQSDLDAIKEEKKQIILKEKLNKEFRDFAKRVEEKSLENDTPIEFEIPYRDLEFVGAPNRSAVKLCPTTNCLVNLSEYPFFVLSLDDIEIAVFERIRFGLKQFDLVLVPKDYSKGLKIISSIPMKKFDLLKDWLLQIEIPYFEIPHSLMWDDMFQHIKSLPSWNPWDEYGWKSLLNTEEEEGENDGEDGNLDDYQPESDEDEFDEDNEDDEDMGDVVDEDEEDEDEDDFEDSEDEGGKTWEELEAEIEEEERKRKRSDDEDDDIPRKKRRY